jgi:cyclopropane fatty-acyl-phospholipid synthase-like methyltransferase
MEKSVDSSKYNKDYFGERYQYVDYEKIKNVSEFGHTYQKAGSILLLKENDKVVDLGCGSGQLSFYLNMKYGCDVTGVDYSPDAIHFCGKNLEILSGRSEYKDIRKKVRFYLSNNDNLPKFENIKAVYLIDVLEHLYDEETKLILEKIKKWETEKGIYLIIHTDNNNYLRFVRPFTDFISVFLGKTTWKKIKEGKEWDAERHVNLMTARVLKKKLEACGFRIKKLKYSPIDEEMVKVHLGQASKIKPLLYLAYFFGKLFYFLRPSFYMLAINK